MTRAFPEGPAPAAGSIGCCTGPTGPVGPISRDVLATRLCAELALDLLGGDDFQRYQGLVLARVCIDGRAVQYT